jgi:uncharacterized membrane protein YedE/YeeE
VKYLLAALMSGLIFGAGLGISGAANPVVINGFLDVAGHFNPVIGAVMVTSISIGLVSFRLILKQSKPVLADNFIVAPKRDVDARLIGGSLVFGVGWGLSGFCVGPALVGLTMMSPLAVLYILAALAGMFLFNVIEQLIERSRGRAETEKA